MAEGYFALVLHALAILKEMDFRDYGLVTVLINADEEMSSPGSRKLITREGERSSDVARARAIEHIVLDRLDRAFADARTELRAAHVMTWKRERFHFDVGAGGDHPLTHHLGRARCSIGAGALRADRRQLADNCRRRADGQRCRTLAARI